jgi:ATPase subunit of ABC transporter with duplicated ATPase domains
MLSRLSGGQVSRARLAALMFSKPDFILLDEPTNNLDREGRSAVTGLLRAWRGGAIVASHDRDLLESMDTIVEMTTLGISRYGGNWSAYRARKETELDSAQHDLADAEKRVAEIDRKAQAGLEGKARKDGVGRRNDAKGGIPRIFAGGRKD